MTIEVISHRQDFRYVLEMDNLRYLYSYLILRFDFCFVLDFALAAMGLDLVSFFKNKFLTLHWFVHHVNLFIIQTLPGVVLS